jgi:hypothetical protein
MRFVPLDGQPILKESLTCLRLISCSEQSARVLNAEMREAAYSAWRGARNDIFEEWMLATDPANLQPRVRPLLRRAAELVRKFPPKDMEQDKIDDIANSLEAPWGARTEQQIREAMGDTANGAAAGRVVETVKRLGLKPYQAPEPLPPITVEDVALVCWMAVERALTPL